MGVLVRELAALYAAFVARAAVAAAAAAGAVRRLRRLAARAGWPAPTRRRQLDYWRGSAWRDLSAAGAAHRPAPPGRARLPRRHRCVVGCPGGTWPRAAPRSARANGATLFMALLAAFDALLARYTRPGRHRGRHAGRRPQPRRRSRADRLLRQHPGAAHRPRRRPDLRRAAGAGARRRRWTPTPTRTCRSSSWSRSCRPERDLSPQRRCSR